MTVNTTGCEFDSHSRKRNIYLNFYSHVVAGLGVKAKRGVEFRHSTRCLQNSAENGPPPPASLLYVCRIQCKTDFNL